MTHKEPSTTDEIPELCKATFVTSRTGLALLWVLAGVLVSMCSVGVGWAMATDKSITELKATQTYLTDQINSKLDKLLKAKGE